MPTKSAPFKIGAKVAGMYMTGRGTCLDYSGIVTACDDKSATVIFKNGTERSYRIPASDYMEPLRICTGCGKPSILERCISHGGCGARTVAA